MSQSRGRAQGQAVLARCAEKLGVLNRANDVAYAVRLPLKSGFYYMFQLYPR